MTDSGGVAKTFLRAYYQGDETAKQILTDDVSFEGPHASFTGIDSLIASSAHVAESVKRVEINRVFVDDDDVCVLYDVYLLDNELRSCAVAQWFVLREGKIARTRVIFDTAPFGGNQTKGEGEAR